VLAANYRPEPKPGRAPASDDDHVVVWADRQRRLQKPLVTTNTSDAKPPIEQATTSFASLRVRALAYAIDMVVVWLTWYASAWFGSLVLHGVHDVGTDLVGTLWMFAWPVLYFAVGTWDAWRTPGMLLLRTRVMRTDGAPLGFGAALLRAALFSAGFAVVVPVLANWAYMVTGKRQGFHDLLTKAVVAQE
jgi:uncharacterized RDD family membrane protein YckC